MPRTSGRSRAGGGVPLGVGVRRALEWNHRAIKCVAFDPALQKLAGGGLDGTVTLWDTADGKLLHRFEWRRSAFEWQRQWRRPPLGHRQRRAVLCLSSAIRQHRQRCLPPDGAYAGQRCR